MTDLVVLDRAHSRISPSSFARAEACTASVRLSADAPSIASGPDALAGSAAHLIAETCLKNGLDVFELGNMPHVTVTENGGSVAVEVDQAMLDGVQVYLDAVREATKGRKLEVEQQIHLGFAEMYLGAPIWGHADALVRDPPFLVADYKNGFQPVAADAVQLGLYLLMVAVELDPGLDGDGKIGTTMIVQPNASGEPVKTHDWTWADLRVLRDRVITTLRRIKRQDWTYADGDHCRFCPAAGFCPHLAAVARDAALAVISPTPEMVASGEISADTLADWLDVVDRLDSWAKAVQATALDYAVHGGVLRNRKLVRKRTVRRWIDPEAAPRQLAERGIDPWERKLITPAEAERRLPPATRAAIESMTEKPDGELTLAASDDKREPINVGASLTAALKASVAAGFIQAAQGRQLATGTKEKAK